MFLYENRARHRDPFSEQDALLFKVDMLEHRQLPWFKGLVRLLTKADDPF
jgi:hypothetical protein